MEYAEAWNDIHDHGMPIEKLPFSIRDQGKADMISLH